MEIDLPDLDAVDRLARAIAAKLRRGDALLLEGPFGAGKTALARALLRALSGDAALEVPSPSYTLLQSYETPNFTVHHFDLWRLDGPDAVLELGWHEAREDVVIVEWPDRLGALAPDEAWRVGLRLGVGDGRVASVEGGVAGDAAALGRLPSFAKVLWFFPSRKNCFRAHVRAQSEAPPA
jgi:tRNA threonylcarbamoyladenosine biosynthesis protein TsaE